MQAIEVKSKSTVVPTTGGEDGCLSVVSLASSTATSTPMSSNRTSVCFPLNNSAATQKMDGDEEEGEERDKQFLSLPRRTRGSRSYSSWNRSFASSSYLSRYDEKRRSDSMLFQKVLLPLPACDRSSHIHSCFHSVFDALRNPACRLSQLNLSKCSLSVADSMCLGMPFDLYNVLVVSSLVINV